MKEIEEEMGVQGVTLQHHFDFWHVRCCGVDGVLRRSEAFSAQVHT